MAKSKLINTSKEFIEGDSSVKKSDKGKMIESKKKMKTFHISQKAENLLWSHRVKTGENLSKTIDRLILENLDNR